METKRKKAYFGISKSNRVHFDQEIKMISSCLENFNIDLMVFVDQYTFQLEDEQKMMNTAFEAIDRCDLIIVELSKKAIGVGVEVGYAFAKGKEIIYLKKKDSKHSTTVGGCTKHQIEYANLEQLKNKLDQTLKTIKNK